VDVTQGEGQEVITAIFGDKICRETLANGGAFDGAISLLCRSMDDFDVLLGILFDAKNDAASA
jgi:hypothetical protein